MNKLHYVAKGLLLYETLDADQFMQAFDEELSLNEEEIMSKKESVITEAEYEVIDEVIEEKPSTEKIELKKEFKLPEDEDK